MKMKRCPVCGELYSETYRDCPFCEEEEAFLDGEEIRRKVPHGKRAAGGRGFSPVTLVLIVLIILMSALLIHLLRDDSGSSQEEENPSQEEVIPPVDETTDPDETVDDPNQPDDTQTPDDSTVVMPEDTDTPDDTTTPEGTTPPESETDPEDTQTTDEPVTTDPPEDSNSAYDEAMALPDGLTLSITDFTLRELAETHTIRVSGGGSYTWISEDDGIASVDSNGKVTAISRGTINVVATDGNKKGVCIVRVTAEGSLPTPPASTSTPTGGNYKLNKEDFTRSVSEGSYQLTVSGGATGVTWTSSNTSVATVSGNGLVTPVGSGTATITASCNGQSMSCIVRVPG